MIRQFLIHGIVAGALAMSVSSTSAYAQAVTPRTPDGHPNLHGIWTRTERRDVLPDEFKPETGNFAYMDDDVDRDDGIIERLIPNRPHYKPEFWPRVRHLDTEGSASEPDPIFVCLPAGVPRMGPPSEIVQTPALMIFLYARRDEFRRIYMDGRPHPPEQFWWGTWKGHSVGHWEGDTLVVSTVDFTDASWLGYPGYLHSVDMRVTERFRREGNKLIWQATVEDPSVLLRPWVMDPVTVELNPDPLAEVEEALPCKDKALPNLVTKERG
jgi:hypothetical protein